MSNAFTKLSQDKLNAAVADLLCPRIETILGDRGPGHCMRVTDLDDDIMESVCKELRRTRPDGNIFILGSHDQEGMPFRVTSTKLVELRNPDGSCVNHFSSSFRPRCAPVPRIPLAWPPSKN